MWKEPAPLHRWQKFYTAAGTDGTDKFHLCLALKFCLTSEDTVQFAGEQELRLLQESEDTNTAEVLTPED